MKQAFLAAGALACAAALPSHSAQAAGDGAAGRQKAQMCAVCHGLDGIARAPDAPHIAGANPTYMKSQLEAFKAGRREHQQMTIIAQGLSDQEIDDLVAWYSSITIEATMPE